MTLLVLSEAVYATPDEPSEFTASVPLFDQKKGVVNQKFTYRSFTHWSNGIPTTPNLNICRADDKIFVFENKENCPESINAANAIGLSFSIYDPGIQPCPIKISISASNEGIPKKYLKAFEDKQSAYKKIVEMSLHAMEDNLYRYSFFDCKLDSSKLNNPVELSNISIPKILNPLIGKHKEKPSPEDLKNSKILSNKAWNLLEKGDHSNAKKLFHSAVKKNTKNVRALLGFAGTFAVDKKIAEMNYLIKKAEKFDSKIFDRIESNKFFKTFLNKESFRSSYLVSIHSSGLRLKKLTLCRKAISESSDYFKLIAKSISKEQPCKTDDDCILLNSTQCDRRPLSVNKINMNVETVRKFEDLNAQVKNACHKAEKDCKKSLPICRSRVSRRSWIFQCSSRK